MVKALLLFGKEDSMADVVSLLLWENAFLSLLSLLNLLQTPAFPRKLREDRSQRTQGENNIYVFIGRVFILAVSRWVNLH